MICIYLSMSVRLVTGNSCRSVKHSVSHISFKTVYLHMVSVIVVPTTLASSEYLEIPQVEEIRPLQLLVIEERLDEMIGRISKLIKEINMCIPLLKGSQLHLETLAVQYVCRPAVFTMRSFDELLAEVDARVSELQESLPGKTGKGVPQQPEQEKAPDQYVFIDTLYFLVPWHLRRRFLRLFDPQVSILVKRVGDDAIYTVYCLKSEVKSIQRSVYEMFKRDVTQISGDVLRCTNVEDRNTAEKERLWPVLEQCTELLVFVSILRGFAEVLNKYGLPPDFKYKITGSVGQEIKRLKKLRKATKEDIYDSIAIVNIL